MIARGHSVTLITSHQQACGFCNTCACHHQSMKQEDKNADAPEMRPKMWFWFFYLTAKSIEKEKEISPPNCLNMDATLWGQIHFESISMWCYGANYNRAQEPETSPTYMNTVFPSNTNVALSSFQPFILFSVPWKLGATKTENDSQDVHCTVTASKGMPVSHNWAGGQPNYMTGHCFQICLSGSSKAIVSWFDAGSGLSRRMH